jgi:hypothetical protein
MREDIDELFADAPARPGGAVGRGPKRYFMETHPERLRAHLACRVVDVLEPIVQAHTIEGLVMGEA